MVKQRKGGKAAAAKAANTETKKPEGDAEVDVDEVRPPPVTPPVSYTHLTLPTIYSV